jgi:recombination protein RecR
MFSGLLGELVKNLKKLPGVGQKSAQRMAMHIINMNKAEAELLAETIKDTVNTYKNCKVCNMLTEQEVCEFCSNEMRSAEQLCIVENTQDVYLIENTHEFKGKYFILKKLLSPIDGIGPDQINFPKLKQYIKHHNTEELILALNPSAEGESTISFLGSELQDSVKKITRLSTGLPFGGDIEYTSSITLGNALKRRYSVED